MKSHDLEIKYADHNAYTSIQRGGDNWNDFFKGIFASVRNQKLNEYPFAKLNDDQSISFLIHKCDEKNCEECKVASKFSNAFKTDYIVEQLELYRDKFKFQLTGEKSQIIEMNDTSATTNVIECRINLTPENLDSILKLSHNYSYRGPDNICKLRKQCQIKPGSIYLFPVIPLDEKSFAMRAAGCQITEMPTVQLLHLLPEFNGLEKYFHWVPQEVTDQLSLGNGDIENLLVTLLLKQKMLEKGFYTQSAEGNEVIFSGDAGPIKIVDMDEKARDFYLLYGNCSAQELKECKSLEINTKDFFLQIYKHLREKFDSYMNDKFYQQHADLQQKYISKTLTGLKNILQMYENEKNRLQVAASQEIKAPVTIAPHVTLHSPLTQVEDVAKTPTTTSEQKPKA